MKRKVIVVFSYPLCLRNFIHSGLLNELTINGYEVTTLSPYKNEFFEDEWGNKFPNVHIPTIGFDKWGTPMIAGTGWVFRILLSLRLRGYSIEYPEGSLQTMDLCRPDTFLGKLAWVLVKMFPRKSASRRWLRRVYDRLGPGNETIRKAFADRKPDLLVTSTMGHFPMDFIAITEAKKRNVKTVCILLSWDNLYSRGPVYKHPDKLMVWSGIMKKQALDVHQFAPDKVATVGPLQFVNYAQPLTTDEKTSTRAKFSLNEEDKYILYVCGGRTPQYDLEDIKALVETLKNSEYKDYKVIVRPHPQVDANQYDEIKKLVMMDYSPSLIGVKDPSKLFEKADIRHFASLLSQAEYVISSWGTTALLEACLFDRKVVQLNWFDTVPHQDETQRNSVKNFQKYYHMKEFDLYNGRLFSHAPSDLVLRFHELDRDNARFAANRARIRKDFTLGDFSKVTKTIVAEIGRRPGD